MKRIETVTVVAAIMCCCGLVGCADPEPVAKMSSPSPDVVNASPIEGGLVFETVLQSGDVEMFPTFADMNADAKPDLILGTVKGVSVQLNQSTKEQLRFAEANRVAPTSSEHGIPWG